MKKLMYFAAAALAVVSMASCDGNGKSYKGPKIPDQVYTGVIPAADAAGFRYTVKLDYDDDDNNMRGDYDLTEIVIVGDSTSPLGYKDAGTYLSEGDFTVVEQNGKKYLKLVKDPRKSNAIAVDKLNFLVSSDSTITLVNDDLEESIVPGLNYTLKLAK